MKGLVRRWRAHSLSSDRIDKRLRAISKLADSNDPRVLPMLIEMLQDEEPEVREIACSALAGCKDFRATRPLVKVVLNEVDHLVLERALAALACLMNAQGLSDLIASLDDDDTGVRQAGARALRRVCWDKIDVATKARVAIMQGNWAEASALGPAAIAPLMAQLHAGTQLAKREAVEALGNIGTTEAIDAMLRVLRSKDISCNIKKTAAWGLRRMCMSDVKDVDLATIAVTLRDWADVKTCGNAAVGALVAVLNDEDTDVRRAAAKSLGAIGTDDAVAALIETLADPEQDVSVRELAVTLLCEKYESSAVRAALAAALADESWSVREAAAGALADKFWMPATSHERALFAIARKDWQAVKSAGVEAIGPLTKVLNYSMVGPHAARALVSVGQEGRDALVDVLRHKGESLFVREVASMALAEAGDARAVEPLKAMLSDPDVGVRQSTVGTLERLGWTPTTGPERAVSAMAHGDWNTVRQLGNAAVEPLLRVLGEDLATEEAVSALEYILDSGPGRISIERLRELANLKDPRPARSDFRSAAEPSEARAAVRAKVDCAKLRHMAQYELIRRGIMF